MKRERNEDDQESEQEDEGEQQQMPINETAVSNGDQTGDAEDENGETPTKKSRTSSSSSTPRRKSTPKPILTPNSREDVLKKGNLAPDFTLLDQDGKEVTLSDFRGKEVVLFFYPKDNTPASTKECQQFTKFAPDFERNEIVVLGVSCDSVKSHQNFIKKFNLNVRLLSDHDMQVIQLYHVVSKAGKGPRTCTYVIGKDGVITHVYPKVKAEIHARILLEELLPVQTQMMYDYTKQMQQIQMQFQNFQQFQNLHQLQFQLAHFANNPQLLQAMAVNPMALQFAAAAAADPHQHQQEGGDPNAHLQAAVDLQQQLAAQQLAAQQMQLAAQQAAQHAAEHQQSEHQQESTSAHE